MQSHLDVMFLRAEAMRGEGYRRVESLQDYIQQEEDGIGTLMADAERLEQEAYDLAAQNGITFD